MVGAASPAGPGPAFARGYDTSATTNLTPVATDPLSEKLALARQLRQAQNFEQAEKCLVTILETDQPDEEITRKALLELAATMQDRKQPLPAQQIFAQYVQRYPQDPGVPEVLLRQGLLYREMGAQTLALAKFYAVMTTVLNLKLDTDGGFQRLVLQAQTEIAETYYRQGKYAEAVECLARLLKLDYPNANRTEIQLKMIRCSSALGHHEDVVGQGYDFLRANPQHADEPEVRFLLISSLNQLGRKADALREARLLIGGGGNSKAQWTYWKQRLGNDFANQLYSAGDYGGALEIYQGLLHNSTAPSWQLPLDYQIALCYERLRQPDRAAEVYDQIIARAGEPGRETDPSLQTVLDMTRWRKKYLTWQTQAKQATQTFLRPANNTPLVKTP